MILEGIHFHLDFLEHHLQNAIFPSQTLQDNPPAPFATDPSRRYLSNLIASRIQESHLSDSQEGSALLVSSILGYGGKPVMNQSALHGFHVFEGLQIVVQSSISDGYKFGYTFLREKVAKLIDGIIRIRFAIHLLKVNVLLSKLENINHSNIDSLKERFSNIADHSLPYRRAQAEEFTTWALMQFVDANRGEMIEMAKINPHACFYVRIEAQGGNRESIGQGPIGVGQSTLQILGQYAQKPTTPGQVVINPDAPCRMHTLAGPFPGSPIYELLNNSAVHHGNMGHQHLASEMAQAYGSDMLMITTEIEENGLIKGPFIAETNFSNIGFIYDTHLIFPQSKSATYGLTQHVIRQALAEKLDKCDSLDGITSYELIPLTAKKFMADLREGRLTGAFIMGSMPGIRAVGNICVDETLSGGLIQRYTMNHNSTALKTLSTIYQEIYYRHIVWE